MRKFLIAAAGVVALAAPALAADMAPRTYTKAPPPVVVPAYDWSGFYIGVNGGYGWTDREAIGEINDRPTGPKPKGGFGGGQIGYNWQAANYVFGIETDIQGADLNHSFVDSRFGDPWSQKLSWFGTVRGRVGYAFTGTPLLVYATGGFAYGHTVFDLGSAGGFTGAPYHFDGTQTGYVVGAGLEYKFASSWSVKAEYQYLNFGVFDPANAAGVRYSSTLPSGDTFLRDNTIHTVRLGINHSFGGPVVAKY